MLKTAIPAEQSTIKRTSKNSAVCRKRRFFLFVKPGQVAFFSIACLLLEGFVNVVLIHSMQKRKS